MPYVFPLKKTEIFWQIKKKVRIRYRERIHFANDVKKEKKRSLRKSEAVFFRAFQHSPYFSCFTSIQEPYKRKILQCFILIHTSVIYIFYLAQDHRRKETNCANVFSFHIYVFIFFGAHPSKTIIERTRRSLQIFIMASFQKRNCTRVRCQTN